MSFKAVGWAMETGRRMGRELPAALRLLLICVADRQNDDTGYTFVRPRMLAVDHGNSLDWVKGALRQLEQLGLIARVRRLKPDGSHDTSLLIVLVDEAARARAAELGWTPPLPGATDETEDAEVETQDVGGWGPNYPHPTKVGGRGAADPQGGGESTPTSIDEPGSEPLSPLPPSRATREAALVAGQPLAVVPSDKRPAGWQPDGWSLDTAGADAFLASWEPKTAGDLPEVVRRTWAKLSAEDRRQAVARLADWRAQMRREGKRFGTAKAYLRDKAWQALDHVRAGRRDGSAMAVFWVREGSAEWEAWARHEGREGRRMVAFPSKHEAG
ncbi:MAG: hypothetical protein FD152_3047, partial [Xanthobacteraceae bacterium]